VDVLDCPLGTFELERVPVRPRQPLRAWDAADEYLLEAFGTTPPADGASVAIVNDSFGALAVALRSHTPILITESAAGREAVQQNLARNDLGPLTPLSMLELGALDRPIDVLIVKIPKSNAHLADLLGRIRPHLHPGSTIIGAAMSKHVRTSTIECFASMIGPTTTSLARKKARLVHATFDPDLTVEASWPVDWEYDGLTLVNHGGGFSPESVDVGTRFLLDNLPPVADLLAHTGAPAQVVDLGCGNGIIGLRLARDLDTSGIDFQLHFVDDSALAIDAAARSWEATRTTAVGGDEMRLHHCHRLVKAVAKNTADLVVVNPPFHDDRVIGDDTAWSMFTDAHSVLVGGGQIVVVGNRHLAYHAKLRKIFGEVDTIASSSKFVLLRARKRAK